MAYTYSQTNYKINPLVKGIMDENNPLMLEVLNRLIYLSHRHSRVFVSQGTLAASLGISLKWVNRLLARWKEMGVLCYRQQGFNRSCLYIINPLLFQDRERLKWKLSALKLLLHVSALCSGLFGEEFLLSNIRNIYSEKYKCIIADWSKLEWSDPLRTYKKEVFFIKNHISSFQEDVPTGQEREEFQKIKGDRNGKTNNRIHSEDIPDFGYLTTDIGDIF